MRALFAPLAHGLLLLFFSGQGHARALQLMTHQLTPPNGVNVYTLTVHPLVIVVFPPIKMDLKK